MEHHTTAVPPGTIERGLRRAIAFLADCQGNGGGFPAERWDRTGIVPEDELFVTSCVLLAAGDLIPRTRRETALALLWRRRGPAGLWHFDSAGMLPADADDTALALAALFRFAPADAKPAVADFDCLRAFVHPDGRIATWLATDSLADPETDDVVVAANVIYAIALSNPAWAGRLLTQWLARQASRTAPAAAPYYLHPETIWYAWARALRTLGLPGPEMPPAEASLQSPLRAALALAGAASVHDDLTALLLDTQRRDGSWPAEPWFQAPGALFGSASLTTAIAVEALKPQRTERTGSAR
jgi:hypothetical protein